MWEDPIVAEVRKIREDYAAQFNFDLQTLYCALKTQEWQDPHPKGSYPPKPVKIAPRQESEVTSNVPRDDRESLLREIAAWEAASDEDALKIENLLTEKK
jgi:hypothetical protein